MLENPVMNLFDQLSLFDRKILKGISRRVRIEDKNTKAYTFKLIDFELDHLNPSDITERLKRLAKMGIMTHIDGQEARVPLLTHIQYRDPDKTVTLTFNSLLKPYYVDLQEKVQASSTAPLFKPNRSIRIKKS
ncbi:hypothetical protein GCM10011391_29470 [Pullulanibacillus camelliae]|uniref:Initiator Rep protein WH1 domain-containing protein n=1 Tax=Pullulanibacillus camelliae TaxID=1707096 RepID=A0A8J3DXW9_9BACL|nr:RepB family plasmid replication initiator protein [Pullulanibacillus camelliae]GGE48747.1 hypothetical protein GCM10011391_29470 [Pullulanibacillus camelliae]